MDTSYSMMNIKNIMITTGMTLLFGLYSIYNILGYLNKLNHLNNYKLLEIQKKMDETDKKCKNLQFDFVKIKEELNILSDKIVSIENELTEHSKYLFSSNYEYDDYDESSEEEKKLIEPVCDEKCDFNDAIPKIRLDTMNSISEKNYLQDKNIINEVLNEKLEYECIEIVNINDINTLHLSPCSSRKNSLTNSEKDTNYKLSKSISISDVNWSGLTKNFLFG